MKRSSSIWPPLLLVAGILIATIIGLAISKIEPKKEKSDPRYTITVYTPENIYYVNTKLFHVKLEKTGEEYKFYNHKDLSIFVERMTAADAVSQINCP